MARSATEGGWSNAATVLKSRKLVFVCTAHHIKISVLDFKTVSSLLHPLPLPPVALRPNEGHFLLRSYRASWIFRRWDGVETGWSWLRIGTGGGHL